MKGEISFLFFAHFCLLQCECYFRLTQLRIATIRNSPFFATSDSNAEALMVEIEKNENVSGIPKNDPEWKFFDTARINVKGGDGGDGCVAFRREKGIPMGGPSGGNGSTGGSVILLCDAEMNTLGPVRNKVHFKGLDGSNGQGKGRHAANPKDTYVLIPRGTVIRDEEGVLCGELTEEKQQIVVARGGRGGRGNLAFKSERNNAPKFMEKGERGVERWLSLELKVLADVGLVGVPNAGKSTLLAAVSNAKPKIADYPFTTVVPNLGVWEGNEDSSDGLVLADIPGLLEGAHAGVGLGLSFLRHIQRCRLLIHVVSGDSIDPVGDYVAIQQELELFSPKLAEKPQVVVLNKIDLPKVAEAKESLERELLNCMSHKRLMSISAVKKLNTNELMHRVKKFFDSLPKEENLFVNETVRDLERNEENSFQILSDPAYPGQWRVTGATIERTVQMTNWKYYEAILRFQRIVEAMRIKAALKKAGAREGDLIMIDAFDFEFKGDGTLIIEESTIQ